MEILIGALSFSENSSLTIKNRQFLSLILVQAAVDTAEAPTFLGLWRGSAGPSFRQAKSMNREFLARRVPISFKAEPGLCTNTRRPAASSGKTVEFARRKVRGLLATESVRKDYSESDSCHLRTSGYVHDRSTNLQHGTVDPGLHLLLSR
jgi:hypothetical protein